MSKEQFQSAREKRAQENADFYKVNGTTKYGEPQVLPTKIPPAAGEQRSEEWFKDRYGKFTASQIHKLLGVKGLGQTGETYAIEKAIETLYGQVEENMQSWDMKRGIELEPIAFAKFKELYPETVESYMFPFGEHAGASPDGVVGTEAVLEIKCPRAVKFFKLVADGNIDKEYIAQMQMQMMCSNSKRAYFFNYVQVDGREYHHTIIVERDDAFIDLMKVRLAEAIKIKEAYIVKLLKNAQYES